MPAKTIIQVRRGTSSSWQSSNPTLQSGELAFEKDANMVKLGDGTTAWNELNYLRYDGGSLDPQEYSAQVSTGDDVSVELIASNPNRTGLNLTFDSVSGAGTTTVTDILEYDYTSPSLPGGFVVGDSIAVFRIESTATFSGNITACFFLPSYIDEQTFNACRIFKLSSGTTTDVTVLAGPDAPDFATRKICATVDGFSEFFIVPEITAPTTTPTPTTTTTPTPTTTTTPTPATTTPAPTTTTTPTPTAQFFSLQEKIYSWVDI